MDKTSAQIEKNLKLLKNRLLELYKEKVGCIMIAAFILILFFLV
jgi:hypothetical protein